MNDRTEAARDFEELVMEPENMNVGQLNHVVRALRERLYLAALKSQDLQADLDIARGNAAAACDLLKLVDRR